MACVAMPTCPLALAESERALPGVIDALEAELERLQLSGEEFSVRMTGCSNSCARPAWPTWAWWVAEAGRLCDLSWAGGCWATGWDGSTRTLVPLGRNRCHARAGADAVRQGT